MLRTKTRNQWVKRFAITEGGGDRDGGESRRSRGGGKEEYREGSLDEQHKFIRKMKIRNAHKKKVKGSRKKQITMEMAEKSRIKGSRTGKN